MMSGHSMSTPYVSENFSAKCRSMQLEGSGDTFPWDIFEILEPLRPVLKLLLAFLSILNWEYF